MRFEGVERVHRLRPSWPGSGPPGAARRASWGTAAATARRAGRPPCRAAASASSGSIDWGAAAMSAQGSPRRRTSSGTVRMVSSSGTTVSTSSHVSGVETWPPVRGRANQAPKTVLWGAFWLKSTKTRLPALLLPPVGRDQVGIAALELAGQRDGGGADLAPSPSAARAGGTRAGRCCPSSSGSRAGRARRAASRQSRATARTSSKPMPGRGVEVDAQLVGVGGVGGEVGPQVQAEAADVHGPHDVGDVGDDERVGGRAVRCGDGGRLQPVRGARRDALLVEGLAGGAVGEALQHGGPPAGGVQQVVADLEVVRDEVELGGVEGGEVDLVRPRDAHLAPVDLHRSVRRPLAPHSTLPRAPPGVGRRRPCVREADGLERWRRAGRSAGSGRPAWPDCRGPAG